MQDERCEVCGEIVPRDMMLIKGKLLCCRQCARPRVVDSERVVPESPEVPVPNPAVRRIDKVVSQIDEFPAAPEGTLRMRVATLTTR